MSLFSLATLKKLVGCTKSHTTPRPARQESSRYDLSERLRFTPELEQLDERILPSLTPVGANAAYPFSAVVEVQVTFPDHQSYVGSGAMIDSFHVLTAGHMLYSAADGGFATSIRVIPELNGTQEPFGYAMGTYERVDSSWINWSKGHPDQTSSSVEDIGLITLNSNIGNRTGWFGFGCNNNNAAFTNQYYETAGYPASYGYSGKQMDYSFGKTTGVQGDDILSTEGNITIIPGQSGSPLWNTSNNVIYGVISGYSNSVAANSQDLIARISQSVFNELQSWRNSDAKPAASVMASVNSLAGPSGSTNLGVLEAETLRNAASAPASSAIGLASAPVNQPTLPGVVSSPTTPQVLAMDYWTEVVYATTSGDAGALPNDLLSLSHLLLTI